MPGQLRYPEVPLKTGQTGQRLDKTTGLHAFSFNYHYLLVPRSITDCDCVCFWLSCQKQTQIHKYMWTRAIQINANSSHSLSRSPSDDPALGGVGWAVPPPTSFNWLTSVLASGDLTGGAAINSPLCDRSRVFGGAEVKTDPGWAACGVMQEASYDFKVKSEGNRVTRRLHFEPFTWMWLQTAALPTSRRAGQLAYQLAALSHPSSLGQERWHISPGRNRWGVKEKQPFTALLICIGVIQSNDLPGISGDKLA